MLMLVIVERLRSLFLPHDRVPTWSRGALKSVNADERVLAPRIVEITSGVRYQLLRALRAMARGEFMVVEHRIPNISREYLEDDDKRAEWFRSLRSPHSWNDASKITPLLVPGTAYPAVIGRIIISAGWCAPVRQPHWVPNLRFFYLTENGRESLQKAQAWWHELTPLERLRVMLVE